VPERRKEENLSQSAMVRFLGDKMIHVSVTFLNDLTRSGTGLASLFL
jgi:hypothetical protein